MSEQKSRKYIRQLKLVTYSSLIAIAALLYLVTAIFFYETAKTQESELVRSKN